MRHYTETELEQYRSGHMNPVRRLLCTMHLWSCAECQKQLDKIDEDELLLADLKQSLSEEDEVDENPDTYQKFLKSFVFLYQKPSNLLIVLPLLF